MVTEEQAKSIITEINTHISSISPIGTPSISKPYDGNMKKLEQKEGRK